MVVCYTMQKVENTRCFNYMHMTSMYWVPWYMQYFLLFFFCWWRSPRFMHVIILSDYKTWRSNTERRRKRQICCLNNRERYVYISVCMFLPCIHHYKFLIHLYYVLRMLSQCDEFVEFISYVLWTNHMFVKFLWIQSAVLPHWWNMIFFKKT